MNGMLLLVIQSDQYQTQTLRVVPFLYYSVIEIKLTLNNRVEPVENPRWQNLRNRLYRVPMMYPL